MTRSPARAADVPHPAPVLLGMPRPPRSFRVEFSSSLPVSELVSGVKPVAARMAGSQQAQQPGMLLPVIQTVTANRQIKHYVLAGGLRKAATTLNSHDEGSPRIRISHRELQAHHQ